MQILSGTQSSGKLHIGNYFGAIAQFIEYQNDHDCLYFIANYHALTSLRDAGQMLQNTQDVALDYLALGLDPNKATLFRQSDIPEIPELFWYLSAVAPMGLLERGHSYKDKTAKGIASNLGLFSYPVLMAADILLYGADAVPVGKDQMQHLEMTRDIATKFNAAFQPGYDPQDPEGKASKVPGALKLPETLVREATAVVPGTDGRKMSKSYGNAIEIFAPKKQVKKSIMGIKSDSTPVEAPKDPDATPIHALLKLFAGPEEMATIDESYRTGGMGYGHYKLRLFELFMENFGEAREKRIELEKDRDTVEDVLQAGAKRAREIAAPVMEQVRRAVGTR